MEKKLTKKDCEVIIERIKKGFISAGLEEDVSFLVYGSYFNVWLDGVSDLDGMFYFKRPFFDTPVASIEKFQTEIRKIYEVFPVLRNNNFMGDVFILDKLHGNQYSNQYLARFS